MIKIPDTSEPPRRRFRLLEWDGASNPFVPALSESEAALASDANHAARELFLQFKKDFDSFCLIPRTQTQPGGGPSLIPEAELRMVRNRWLERRAKLRILCTKTADHAEPFQGPDWTLLDLVDSFPWRRLPDEVFVYIHPRFERPFTALGPTFSVFVAPRDLQGQTPLDAAIVIHELGHIADATQRGWLDYQRSPADDLETRAMSGERAFLQGFTGQNGLIWESSALRWAWNETYANTWLEALSEAAVDAGRSREEIVEEASLYLRVLEHIDPC